VAKVAKRSATLKPPAGLDDQARARWNMVAPQLAARGAFDRETLATYCQVWARWRKAESAIAKTGQLVKGNRGRVQASPLIAVSSQAAAQARALERSLGLDAPAVAAAEPKRKAKAATSQKLLTRRQLAAVLEKHMMTVTKWEQDGMPVAKRGSPGKASYYSEPVVRAWLQLREEAAAKPSAVNVPAERARKERAQAILIEQAYAIRARELLPREEVERAWSGVVSAVRSKLLAVPAAFCDQVYRVSLTDGVIGAERVLLEAIHDVLRELSDPEAPLLEAPAPGESVATS